MKTFIGWTNIKWAIIELGKMYSGQASFFSKKRVEAGIAFAIAQWGMIQFFIEKKSIMTASDLFIWAGIEFGIAGYLVTQTEKQKKDNQIYTNSEN